MGLFLRLDYYDEKQTQRQVSHDLRQDSRAENIDRTKSSENTIISYFPDDVPRIRHIRDTIEVLRSSATGGQTKAKGRPPKNLTIAGVISFSSDVFSHLKRLNKEEQDAIFKQVFDFIIKQLDTIPFYFVVHRDESNPHAHFLVSNIARDGKSIGRKLYDKQSIIPRLRYEAEKLLSKKYPFVSETKFQTYARRKTEGTLAVWRHTHHDAKGLWAVAPYRLDAIERELHLFFEWEKKANEIKSLMWKGNSFDFKRANEYLAHTIESSMKFLPRLYLARQSLATLTQFFERRVEVFKREQDKKYLVKAKKLAQETERAIRSYWSHHNTISELPKTISERILNPLQGQAEKILKTLYAVFSMTKDGERVLRFLAKKRKLKRITPLRYAVAELFQSYFDELERKKINPIKTLEEARKIQKETKKTLEKVKRIASLKLPSPFM